MIIQIGLWGKKNGPNSFPLHKFPSAVGGGRIRKCKFFRPSPSLSLPQPYPQIKNSFPPSFPSSSFRCEMVGEKGRESGIGRGGAITSKKRPPKKGGGESSSVSPRPPRPPRPPPPRSPLLSRPFLNYAMQEMEKRETFPPSPPPLTFIAVFLFPRFPCFNFLPPPPPPSLPLNALSRPRSFLRFGEHGISSFLSPLPPAGHS